MTHNTTTSQRILFGVALVLLALPGYVVRFSIAGIPTTLLECVLLVVVCVSSVLLLRERKKIFSERAFVQPFLLWAALFVLIGASSLIVAPDFLAAAGIYKAYIVEPAVFGVLCVYAIRSHTDVLFLMRVLTIPAAIIASVAIVQYLTGWGIPEPWNLFPGRRTTAVYGYPNAVGLFLAPLIAAFLGMAAHKETPRHSRFLFLAVSALSVIAVLSARADGALVAIVGAVCVLLFLMQRRVVAISIIGIGVCMALLIPATREVILFQDVSGQVRLAMWKGTVRLIQDHPINGAGLSGFPLLYEHYREPAHVGVFQYPHNILLDVWTELGLAGLVWMSGTGIIVFVISRRLWCCGDEDDARLVLAIVTAYLLYGVVDVVYFKNDLSVLFWFFLSAAWSMLFFKREKN